MRWLYHVLNADSHTAGERYDPPSLASEGFIHASYRDAVAESARLYFAGRSVRVLQIDPRRLDVPVVEASTPRGPMPHIHGSIPRDAIRAVLELADVAGAPDHIELFSQLLGLQFVREPPDGPCIRLDVLPHHKNSNSVVHGSVIHALLDTVMGFTCKVELAASVVTVEISVRFLAPVFDGTLTSRARVLRAGKRIIFLDADVRRESELVAVAQGTFARLTK